MRETTVAGDDTLEHATPEAGVTGRRNDVQGLRALAVIMVIAYHAGISPFVGGYVGVDVFFVISGFVITRLLWRDYRGRPLTALGQFYRRRFARLFPAMALMVSVTVVATGLLLAPLGVPQVTAKVGIGAVLLAANLVLGVVTAGYFGAPSAMIGLLHTWSLSVEEQFYLFFPLVILLAWREMRARHFDWYVVAGAGVLPLGALIYLWHVWPAMGVSYFSPFARAWEFALGALIALWEVRGGRINATAGRLVGLVGLAAVLYSAVTFTLLTVYPGPLTLIPVVGAGLVIVGGTTRGTDTTLVGQLLGSRVACWVGDRSYSLYLWHWPLIAIAAGLWPARPDYAVGAAALSVVPALASYRFVENPARRRRWSRSAFRRLVVASVSVPLALSAVTLVGSDHHWWSASLNLDVGGSHVGLAQGCYSASNALSVAYLTGADFQRRCTFNAGAHGSPVYLVGDSNAWQFGEGVIAAARATGHPVIEMTHPGCPFFDVYYARNGRTGIAGGLSQCDNYYRSVMGYLHTAAHGLVITSNADFYFRDPLLGLGLVGGPLTHSESAKLVLYQRGLSASVRALHHDGQRVILIETIPNFVTRAIATNQVAALDVAVTCSPVDVLAGWGCHTTSMPLAAAALREGATWRIERLVSATTHAPLVSLAETICPGGWCRVHQRNGQWDYMDVDHLSVYESRQLAGEFTSLLRRYAPVSSRQ